jgi:thiosulfate/3-mercaptopyruvate sulfurtransferase
MANVFMNLRRQLALTVTLAVVVGLGLGLPAAAEEKYKGFERGGSLITPVELKELMDAGDPKLVLIGVVRGGLTGSFTRGHIPGAYSVWRPDYLTEEGDEYPYEGMVKNAAEFQELARSLGIDNDSKVVVYDEKYDAPRLWWSFYLYGKTDVRVLDGGYEGWKRAGFATKMGTGADRDTRKGNFTAELRNEAMVGSMDDVWRARTDATMQIWDAREPDEWSGNRVKRGAYRKGRVPWAKFMSWKDFRLKVNDDALTEFKPASEIAKVIERHGIDKNKTQLFYCQSGIRTTTHVLVLYLMGWDIEKLLNYDGSWIEWSYYEENPAKRDG